MAWTSFEDREVWKRSCQLAVFVDGCLETNRYASLRDQMQRSAVSIPSNIAEGSERSRKDFSRFLQIALGSHAELRTQASIAEKVGLLNIEQRKQIVDETKRLGKMLYCLRPSLRENGS